MNKFKFMLLLLPVVSGAGLASSCTQDRLSGTEHDGTLYGEWIETGGGTYVHDYYYFGYDGTGIHGSYESDIDLINEDEDIRWYTQGDRHLYVDGVKHEYWCDGTELEITKRGRTRHYMAK